MKQDVRLDPAMTTYETLKWYKQILLWQDVAIVALILTIIYLVATKGL